MTKRKGHRRSNEIGILLRTRGGWEVGRKSKGTKINPLFSQSTIFSP
jgi:hypothetical protein